MPARTNKTYTIADRRQHLANQPISGKTITEYCQNQGLSISTFDNWKRKERKRSLNLFVELSIPQNKPEICINCGSLVFSIPPNIETEQLTKILTAMNRAVQ